MLTADLADRASADRLIEATITLFGRLDILVNNAGIIRRQAAAEHSDEDWDAVLEVNLTSVFRLCRPPAAHARAGRGKIITIASLLSFQGGIGARLRGDEGRRRAAHEGAGQRVGAARHQRQRDRARATSRRTHDGPWRDPARAATRARAIPAGRWGTPDDLAGAAVFLASRASDYVHGIVLLVDGGWMGR